MGKKEEKGAIYFGGKIANFKDKAERAFEQKHLRNFLKGNTRFIHGRDVEGKPAWFPVLRSVKRVLV